jgi:hypothetical protein
MSYEIESEEKLEIGHVLFINIVGYYNLLLTEQSEQQGLCTDITKTQIAGFAHCELEHFLGA